MEKLKTERQTELETITDYFFIARFGQRRFDYEKPYSYYGEWLNRFEKGIAYQHGDLESGRVIEKMQGLKMLENFRQTGLNRKW